MTEPYSDYYPPDQSERVAELEKEIATLRDTLPRYFHPLTCKGPTGPGSHDEGGYAPCLTRTRRLFEECFPSKGVRKRV